MMRRIGTVSVNCGWIMNYACNLGIVVRGTNWQFSWRLWPLGLPKVAFRPKEQRQ